MNNTINSEKVRAGQPYLYRKSGLPSEIYEVRFKEEIDHDILNHALNTAILRYPYFQVRYTMKKGDFYTEHNDLPIKAIHTDRFIPLGGSENNYYLIGVTHTGCSINVAFHHGLTDGRGIKSFVETLIYYYCMERYNNTEICDGVLTCDSVPESKELAEPCGKKYKINRKNLKKIEGLSKKGFTLPETRETPVTHRRYEMKFSQKEFMSVCKKYGASPVILLSIMMSRAIKTLHPDCEEVINSNFPVDARDILDAGSTYKNCVKSVSLPYGTHEQNMTTSDLSTYYKELLRAQRNPDYCKDEFNKIIMLLDILNLMPAYKNKQKVLKFLDNLKLDTYLISYIGQFNLGSNEKYIDSIHLFSDCSDGLVMNMTCECGYFNIDFVQDFESEIYLHELENQFALEGIALSVSTKKEFTTPCDDLMTDIPVLDDPSENVWNRSVSLITGAYERIETGTVNAANTITNAFVKEFLLKNGETVEQARNRLAKEQALRMKTQEEMLKNRPYYHCQ